MSSRKHSYFQDLLETHISGAPLDPEDRFELFDHIETCDECRMMLEAEERLTARMKTIPRMVAPSDLRSKILNQAIRDHTERTTTPSEDPNVADLLGTPSQPAKPAQIEQYPASKSPSRMDKPEEFPFFPGIAPAQPGRFRRAWRKASPALATGFLVVASIGALYTGQFQGIPLASEAQQLVWAAVDSVTGNEQETSAANFAVASSNELPDTKPISSQRQVPEPSGSQAIATAPLPGTTEVVGYIRDARGWLTSLDSTVAALARASEVGVPAPAENSAPQIAALVLKPTDTPADPGGFRQSELAAALETVARSYPGGRLAEQDQFAMNGKRYRLYTLELPAGSTTRLVKNLTPYQATADGHVVRALESQNHYTPASNGDVRFFTGNQSGLRDAIQTIHPVISTGKPERVQVIVVE